MRIANCKLKAGRRKGVFLFGLVLVLTLVSSGSSHGQAPAADANPSVVAPLLWNPDPLGLGAILPTTNSPYQDENGPLLIGNPLLDGGPTGVPGFVAGAEIALVNPHVFNRLFNTVTRASGATDTVQLPSAQIETAVMPRFDVGYRFGQGTGELLFSYRFLNGQATNFASGNDPLFGPGGVAVTSRLSLNTFDLDYGSWEPLTVLGVDMKWRVGVRTLLEFNDSQANNGTVSQSTSNFYGGAGPHAVVDFRRPIFRGSGLNLFARIESAIVWGKLDQNYTENVTTAGTSDFGLTNFHTVTQVTNLAFQAGVTWTPQWNTKLTFSAGYVWEHYWDLGSSAVGTAAREELDINGGFARAEWNY